MAHIEVYEPLRKILQISQQFKQTFSSLRNTQAQPHTTESLSPTPKLNLCLPPHIEAELANENVLEGLRTILRRAIVSLQDDYNRVFDRAFKRSFNSPIPQAEAIRTLSGVIEKRFATQSLPGLYEKHLRAKEEIAISLVAASTIPTTSTAQFNHAFVPILTEYFQWNPFPPVQDRKMLAEKGMMLERQIEVWFQNRRALVKKRTGHTLNKQAYKHKLNKPPPADLFKAMSMIIGGATPGGTTADRKVVAILPESEWDSSKREERKQARLKRRHWREGWGSLGGLCGWGTEATRPRPKEEETALKRLDLQVEAAKDKLEFEDSGCVAKEVWQKEREEGRLSFVTGGFVTSKSLVRDKKKAKDASFKDDMQAIIVAFTSGRVWGDLGRIMDGDRAPPDPTVGAATAGFTRDVRWYCASRGAQWRNSVSPKKETRREAARLSKGRKPRQLGEKRVPTHRRSPRPASRSVSPDDDDDFDDDDFYRDLDIDDMQGLQPLAGFGFDPVNDLLTGLEEKTPKKSKKSKTPEPASNRHTSTSSTSSLASSTSSTASLTSTASSVPSVSYTSSTPSSPPSLSSSLDSDDFASLFDMHIPSQTAYTNQPLPQSQPFIEGIDNLPDAFASTYPQAIEMGVPEAPKEIFDPTAYDFDLGFVDPTMAIPVQPDYDFGHTLDMEYDFNAVPIMDMLDAFQPIQGYDWYP